MKLFKFLPLLLCVAIVGTASAQSKTKQLLDASGYAYAALESGSFKVVISADGKSTNMIVKESAIWGRDDIEYMKVINLYTLVMSAPEGYNPPTAMYKKIVELNDSMLHGRLSISGSSVFFSSSQFLQNTDAQSFDTQLVLAHLMTQQYTEAFAPYLEEE